MDTKYVPSSCKSSSLPHERKFYQYTVIEEASRKRFLYWYEECTPHNTCDFLEKAINFFGYVPTILQTDNGFEYCYTNRQTSGSTHPLDKLCQFLQISHAQIRPRTPRHNGKVERSHRNDNMRLYQYLKFYSLADLRYQGSLYLKRSNDIPMYSLHYKSPNQLHCELSVSS